MKAKTYEKWNSTSPRLEEPLLPKPKAYPKDFQRRSLLGMPKSVGIIGGGIAGLVAAYELTKLGHRVTLLERSSRVGGRIVTQKFVHDGIEMHAEGGAMRIPSNHFATCHYIDKFTLPTRQFVNFNWHAYYRIRDRQARIIDWLQVSPYRPRDGARHQHPVTLVGEMMNTLNVFVPRSHELNGARTKDFDGSKALRKLSQISLEQAWRNLGYADEVIEAVGHATGLKEYLEFSALELLAEYQTGLNAKMLELTDGTEALPEAFARRLGPDTVKLGCEVTDVDLLAYGPGPTLRWVVGGIRQEQTFDYVICTVPTPNLEKVTFVPELPPTQRNAHRNLTYAHASKTLVPVRQRFWEKDDRILGGISYTDLPVSQLVYPSDNAEPLPEDGGRRVWVANTGLLPPGELEIEKGYYGPRSQAVSEGPGVLVAYRWGKAALRHMDLSDSEKKEATLRDIRRIHGGRVDQYLIDDVRHVNWLLAFAHFMPGEHHRHQPQLEVAFPAADPKLFWAGEHVGYIHAWIQSAITTAWDAVLEIAQAPGPLRASGPRRLGED